MLGLEQVFMGKRSEATEEPKPEEKRNPFWEAILLAALYWDPDDDFTPLAPEVEAKLFSYRRPY